MPHYDLLTIVNDQQWGCFSIFRRADDVTRTMSRGGCLWMPKSGGVFQFSGGRMTSRGQCPRGGAYECLHPPPLQEIRACVPPIQVQTPPPPPVDGWLRACDPTSSLIHASATCDWLSRNNQSFQCYIWEVCQPTITDGTATTRFQFHSPRENDNWVVNWPTSNIYDIYWQADHIGKT